MIKLLITYGQRFGRLTVVGEITKQSKRQKIRFAICKCDCGNTYETRIAKLFDGTTKSSGCLRHETNINRNIGGWNKSKVTIGERYGKLIVLREVDTKTQRTLVECLCDCGNKKVIVFYSLTHGLTKSCGCSIASYCREGRTTHGKSFTSLYRLLAHMKERCQNPKSKSYKDYGARGITVCSDWMNIETFYTWAINNGYQHGLTIERIDNDKGYSPDNCRWATQKEQNRNKRNTRLATFNERTQCVGAWAEEWGVHYTVAQRRLKLAPDIAIIEQ